MIGYVGTASGGLGTEPPIGANHCRLEAAVFRPDNEADWALLWLADEAIGPRFRRTDEVYGRIRRDLGQADREASEWIHIVEELSDAVECRAFPVFSEFDQAVDGLASATLAGVPHDLLDNPSYVSEEQSFDLSGHAPNPCCPHPG